MLVTSTGLRAPAFCQIWAHIQLCPSAVTLEPCHLTFLSLSLLVNGTGLMMSSDGAGRAQRLVRAYRRCSINGGGWRWKPRRDREPVTRQEGRSEVLTWVGEIWGQRQFLSWTGKSKNHPQERRLLPGATKVPEPGQGCSLHLLTRRPKVRGLEAAIYSLQVSASFPVKWADNASPASRSGLRQ